MYGGDGRRTDRAAPAQLPDLGRSLTGRQSGQAGHQAIALSQDRAYSLASFYHCLQQPLIYHPYTRLIMMFTIVPIRLWPGNLEKSGNSRVVREKWGKTVLDLGLVNWTKISGTNFFSARFARILFIPPPLNLWHHLWSKSNCVHGLGVWCIVESLPALMEKSRNFMCSGKWSPTPNKYEYWMTA